VARWQYACTPHQITTYIISPIASRNESEKSSRSLPTGKGLEFDYQDGGASFFASHSDLESKSDIEGDDLSRLLVRLHFSFSLPPTGITQGYHPSTNLSKYLLAFSEGASVALVHDDVWSSVLEPVRNAWMFSCLY
jgi:hypothetical protein